MKFLKMMYPATLQLRLERAVTSYEQTYQAKPSLLQISRTDYDCLLPSKSTDARRGLSLRGVTVIGLDDVVAGEFYLLP